MLINLFDIKNEITLIDDKIEIYSKYLIKNNIENELKEIKLKTSNANLWNNPEEAKIITQKESKLENELTLWNAIKEERKFLDELINNINSENEREYFELINSVLENLKNEIEKIYINILFQDKNDQSNCFLTVHCGSGGLESEDWARILFEMYFKFASKYFKVYILDYNSSPDGGIKNATLKIESKNWEFPYGHLKSENGIHRLVRISPYDKNKQRHTSFSSVAISPEINENINIEIKPEEIRIDTYRASGAGGQHVNKTDSAIRITHIESGIVVQCQNDRSQHANKEEAFKMLKSKLYEKKIKELQKEKEELAGEKKESTWGSQIRSYVQQPYQLVKDHRTNAEIPNFEKVVYEGEIDYFIKSYLNSQNF